MDENKIRKKVLIIDDDELQLYTTKELLQDDCCEILTHKSDQNTCVTALVRDLKPDLVLLDVNMPGLSGEQLALVLRWRNSPFVFYSSNDEDSLRELTTTCGAIGYICKGDIAELRKKVIQFLNLPS
jgi:DNA-binding NarL/FixJ family response regulator